MNCQISAFLHYFGNPMIAVCVALNLWICACTSLNEFSVRALRVDSWKEKEHLFMDEYSAADHSVVPKQQGEGGHAKTNMQLHPCTKAKALTKITAAHFFCKVTEKCHL